MLIEKIVEEERQEKYLIITPKGVDEEGYQKTDGGTVYTQKYKIKKLERRVNKNSWLGEVHYEGESPYWTVVQSKKKEQMFEQGTLQIKVTGNRVSNNL